MAKYQINRRLRPTKAQLASAGSLLGVDDNLCIDAVSAEGRRIYVALTDVQAERLVVTLERAINGGFWGDRIPQALIIPHTDATTAAAG